MAPRHLRQILQVFACLALLPVAGRGTSVIPPDLAQLANESDYVIRSIVKSVSSEFRVTSTGRGRKIVTKVELEVREVIVGNAPRRVVLEMLGGRVGEEEMTLEGAPRFKVGDEDILFVVGNGRSICPLRGLMHGRYPILRQIGTNREYVARSNRQPLRNVAEVASPMREAGAAAAQPSAADATEALTPGQFIQQIRAVANASSHRAQQ